MIESEIEREARRYVEEAGGELLKLRVPGRRGFPDRVAVLPGGRIAFIEFKQPGKEPRVEQWRWISWLRSNGFEAFFTNRASDVLAWVQDADDC